MQKLLAATALLACAGLTALTAVPAQAGFTLYNYPANGSDPDPATETPKEVDIDGKRLWRGTYSSVNRYQHGVARTQEEWEGLWKLTDRDPPGFLPVDAMALAVFLGTRGTGGYSVTIETLISDDHGKVAVFREAIPPTNGNSFQIVTSPYAILLVPKEPGPVRFQRRY
ncbi:MAG: hypothetical protein Alpg2KO_03710 [Alphaproteobacteria bacterium]